jgi:putative membrane protein
MMNGFGEHGWGMGWGWIAGLIILVALIWIIVRIVNQNYSSKNSQIKSAIDILKERFARGEISKEEFTEGKKELM